jgi:hypothetical protein
MTLSIERVSDGYSKAIRLIGRTRQEHLEVLKAQIKDSGPAVALDLNEVTLVDMDVVYFLGVCQKQGVKLLHCAPYICDWIAKEQERIK